jgi:hypothetical protein
MAYTPYYAPYYRPMNYYNPSIPQDATNVQNLQNAQQMPIQQPVQQMPMVQPTPIPSNDMIWVLSEVEAQSYPVAPNNSVTLWDKNNDTVYIKSVNMQGVPSMRVLDYTERTAENATKETKTRECKCGENFVAKADFAELEERFNELREEFEDYKSKAKTKNIKTAKTEEEHDGQQSL